MTEAYYQRHLAARGARTSRFIAEPQNYKVCDQCLSIFKRGVRVCPICGAWRWDESPERVVAIARVMSLHAFPQTAGTVPRFSEESV